MALTDTTPSKQPTMINAVLWLEGATRCPEKQTKNILRPWQQDIDNLAIQLMTGDLVAN